MIAILSTVGGGHQSHANVLIPYLSKHLPATHASLPTMPGAAASAMNYSTPQHPGTRIGLARDVDCPLFAKRRNTTRAR
jgi:hypothetical protein